MEPSSLLASAELYQADVYVVHLHLQVLIYGFLYIGTASSGSSILSISEEELFRSTSSVTAV